MKFNYEYNVGTYNWEYNICKIFGGFKTEKQAKEYGEFLDNQILFSSVIIFIQTADTYFFLDQKEKPKNKWGTFDKVSIYDCKEDDEFLLADKVWRSDFIESLKAISDE